jgi:hypothetical protein
MAKGSKKPRELWSQDPEDRDLKGALDFLSLLMRPDAAERLVEGLRNAQSTERKAKDLLRATRLPLLDADDPLVAADLKKIKRRELLPPVLLVRGDVLGTNRPAEVADGYHRICASYYTDESAEIPCRIADP